jgi:16S rRNA (cytosine1402-N4)-methyltransferase
MSACPGGTGPEARTDAVGRHLPVLLEETVEGLALRPGGVYLDGTLGEGGHAREILGRAEGSRLIGLDRDPAAIAFCARALAPFGERVLLMRSNFADLGEALDEAGVAKVDGVLLDVGVSSGQLEDGERGFSFMREGPLDMRMDPDSPLTAADVVNGWSKEDLLRILYEYGEERFAKKVVAAILREREREPIATTAKLAGVVAGALGLWRAGGIHPATRTFQALRIAVNGELDALARALPAGLARLAPGGRMAVISFHSLEDRMVKDFFRTEADPCTCPRHFPHCVCGKKPSGRVITRRVVTASEAEIARNPRSRSARLRVFEKGAS